MFETHSPPLERAVNIILGLGEKGPSEELGSVRTPDSQVIQISVL